MAIHLTFVEKLHSSAKRRTNSPASLKTCGHVHASSYCAKSKVVVLRVLLLPPRSTGKVTVQYVIYYERRFICRLSVSIFCCTRTCHIVSRTYFLSSFSSTDMASTFSRVSLISQRPLCTKLTCWPNPAARLCQTAWTNRPLSLSRSHKIRWVTRWLNRDRHLVKWMEPIYPQRKD